MLRILSVILIVLACIISAIIVSIAAYTLYLLIRRPLTKFYRQRSSEADFCPFEKIPEQLLFYILQTEDAHFFEHPGILLDSIRIAFRYNKRAHKIIMGGSTITQQLIKNLYFRFERNYLRKLIEAILSLYAEKVLGKKKILELYMNIIYFGNGQYGIVDAARFYFNKDLDSLTTNQTFMLVCMPHAPTAANPLKHPDVFVRVRDKKLKILIRGKFISDSEVQYIHSCDETCLDPQLRVCGPKERSYPETIVMINERFGLAQKYPFKRIDCE